MVKPSIEDIRTFIKIFNDLCRYETDKRMKGDKGIFEKFPKKDIDKVMKWLREKTEVSDNDRIDKLKTKYEFQLEELEVRISEAQHKNDYATIEEVQEIYIIYSKFVKDLEDIGSVDDTSA